MRGPSVPEPQLGCEGPLEPLLQGQHPDCKGASYLGRRGCQEPTITWVQGGGVGHPLTGLFDTTRHPVIIPFRRGLQWAGALFYPPCTT